MFDVSAITLYCVFKATPPFADFSVVECLIATQRLLHFSVRSCTDLKLLQYSGKPSPEALAKQHSPQDSDMGCLVVTMFSR